MKIPAAENFILETLDSLELHTEHSDKAMSEADHWLANPGHDDPTLDDLTALPLKLLMAIAYAMHLQMPPTMFALIPPCSMKRYNAEQPFILHCWLYRCCRVACQKVLSL